MTLNALLPADTDLVSSLAEYERETMAGVNSLEALIAALGAVAAVTRYVCVGGQTTIPVGGASGLSEVSMELVLLSGTGVAAITDITGGTEGQMKFFLMLDTNVSFVRDVTKIALNQPASIAQFGGYLGDILALSNINGAPATPLDGYWNELFRTPRAY